MIIQRRRETKTALGIGQKFQKFVHAIHLVTLHMSLKAEHEFKQIKTNISCIVVLRFGQIQVCGEENQKEDKGKNRFNNKNYVFEVK